MPEEAEATAIGAHAPEGRRELQLSDGTGLRIQAVVDDPKSGIVRVLGFTKEEPPCGQIGPHSGSGQEWAR